MGADDVAVEQFDLAPGGAQAIEEDLRDGALAGARQAGEPEREPFRAHEETDSTCFKSTSTVRSARPSGVKWMPHSLSASISHHHRPARRSSPAWTARVHGSQPMVA